jgi:hypothetical protein
VEVLGRYSNLPDQGERLRTLLEIVPEGSLKVNLRALKQVQHRLKEVEVDQLAKAYESGATLKDLARDFRVHRNTAMELLERNGIARRGKGPSDSQVAEAIRLYAEGQSTAVIGRCFGFSADTIRHRLMDAGVEIRSPHDWHRRT